MKKYYKIFFRKNKKKIEKIKKHLEKNKNDLSGRRGLIRKINIRKKMIRYLNRSGEMVNTLL
ncbi:30S ribosomal protein S15 [Candidatus Vidania fulgoroideae]|uniref:30S ribosomal protein S15 n=1 Tax=Candidatus Vidania fulgoroideorum TaxID=881286 RepID=A0AAX3NAH0_9PROT|nr:30S ribosomal protein S15 [Candidatus Vidania fulgoroideae]WDR79383.1 30S ribosomal protein S15 [Candidatus Vidania fulgoroideae]